MSEVLQQSTKKHCSPCEKGVDIALLILRVGLALFFIKHGYEKIFVMKVGMFSNMMLSAWPAPLFWGWLVALTEVFGGLLVLLGVFTRIAASGLAIISLVAWGMVKKFGLTMAVLMPLPNGSSMPLGGGELDMITLAVALALVFAGPGAYALMKNMKHPKMCKCPKCRADGNAMSMPEPHATAHEGGAEHGV